MADSWEYPTKQQQAARRQQLGAIRQYALSKVKTRLRSQHALLYMRCNMLLGQHADNVKFWEQTASGFINSVYRDMMRNIYAGALLKAGRTDEATQIYMEQGDVASLYTYYYKRRSYESIAQEYQRNANSPALPFLLQDFANNAQEAIDAQNDYDNWPGKLFIRDIEKAEAMKMCALARRVVDEKLTTNPALWRSAEAWLQYLFGNRQEAFRLISEAAQLEGTPRVKDNARALRLFITASVQKADARMGDFLATELSWLEEKAREERADGDFYDNHYTQVFDRLVHQVLVPKYDEMGRSELATAFLAVYDEQPKVFRMLAAHQQSRISEYGWNGDYSGDFFYRIDTMAVDQMEKYLAYVQQSAPASAIDHWLSPRIRHDEQFLHELIGTKYLRLCRWDEAERHLAPVSIDFINAMNIAPFMAQRSYKVEPWMKRQRIKEELQQPGSARVTANQKLQFVREMQQLEQGFGALEPTAKAQRAYQLAIRYAQASYAGDAWYLTRYGKGYNEEARADETDLLKKADEMLKTAHSIDEFTFREKVLFAQAYLPMDAWYTEEWSDQKSDYVKVLQRSSHQYQALQALSAYERKNATRTSGYVSRCDVLKQFMKMQ